MTDITVKAANTKETIDPISAALALMIVIFAVAVGAYVGTQAFSVYITTVVSAEESKVAERVDALNENVQDLISRDYDMGNRMSQMERDNQATISKLTSRIRELERKQENRIIWTDNMPTISPEMLVPGTQYIPGTLRTDMLTLPCAGGAPPPECK